MGLFNRKGENSLPEAFRSGIAGSLQALDSVSKGLASRCADFVLDSGDPAVLLELARGGEAVANASGVLGKYYGYFTEVDKPAAQARERRDRAYGSADDSCLPALARLGKLFEAADTAKDFEPICGNYAPLSLQYLLGDLMMMSEKDRNFRSDDALWECLAKKRPYLDFAFLRKLAEADGADVATAFTLVFCRVKYDYFHYKALLRLPGLREAIRAEAESFAAAVARFSAEPKVETMAFLDSSGLVADFYPMIAGFAADSSKQVREAAGRLIGSIPVGPRLELLKGLLASDTPGLRSGAAALIARVPGKESAALLEAAIAAESSKTVRSAMEKALADQAMGAEADGDLALVLPPLPPIPDTRIDDSVIGELKRRLAEAVEAVRKAAEKEVADNKASGRDWKWAQRSYTEISRLGEGDLRALLRYLNGQGGSPPDHQLSRIAASSILRRPDFGLRQALRLSVVNSVLGFSWMNSYFVAWRESHPEVRLDLRSIAAAHSDPSAGERAVAADCLQESWGGHSGPQDELDPELVWPFFAERPEYLEMALGMIPARIERVSVARALSVLETFPSVPARFAPRLLEIALGDAKRDRAGAQALLARLPGITGRVVAALDSAKQESRANAARWLGAMGDASAIPAMRGKLKSEKKETVRAALLSSLERLGGEASEYLAPDILLAEAEKGLKGGAPKSLEWFPFAAMPAVSWAGGGPVPASILSWWIVLAAKLKEAGGNELFRRYLGLLEERGRRELGLFVLSSFIAYDTRCPSMEEAAAYAKANADSRLALYRNYAKREWGAAYAKYDLDMVFEELKREKLATYLGTAIGEKGVLAIASGAEGTKAAALVRAYMKDHYKRHHQVGALVECLASSDDPAAIQLVLSVARRYRTASVRDRARELVEAVAERKGWTADEMADRTIPTGGLEDDGVLRLDYGRRSFEVRLGADLKVGIRNEKGEAIKSLPDPTPADDAALAKESKEALSTLKKTAKQVAELQAARLYEAMCLQRSWPFAEWKELLLEHPLMGFLVQRLLWSSGGKLFRPTEDRALVGSGDAEVKLGDGDPISLAHGSLLKTEEVEAWKRHFADYRIQGLFDQFRVTCVPQAAGQGRDEILDRLGWLGDSFGLRGTLTKLGYQRSQAEDGGVFTEYWKDFTGAGIKAVVEFTGSFLPEENIAAALKGLYFVRSAKRRQARIPIAEVPTVLLGEAYADYLKAAESCAGFDPDWERKAEL